MVDVKIETTVLAPSGYAYAARKLVLGLHELGVNVHLVEKKMDDLTIKIPKEQAEIFQSMFQKTSDKNVTLLRYGTPMVWDDKPPENKRNILKFVWELDELPPLWKRQLSMYDEYITNTKFCKRAIENALTLQGPNAKPVHVVPHGIDTKIYHPDSSKLYDFGENFVFLAVGQWIKRKGFEELVDAFIKEFTGDDKVVLLLKTYGLNNYFPTMLSITNAIKSRSFQFGLKNPPKVIIHATMMTEIDMRRLYNSANAFILPSKGESWGLPYIQSMACGVPCISQRFGGQLEFMNAKNSYLINPETMGVTDGAGPYSSNQGLLWAEPSIKTIRKIMRKVIDDKEGLARRSTQGLKDVKKWTWEKATKKLADVILDDKG
jgi:glycosyltransferase involved in cell wall biosynthesis